MPRTTGAAIAPAFWVPLAPTIFADISVGKSLHRIDEAVLRREVEAAGFKLIAEGAFWRHPADTKISARSGRPRRWTNSR